MTGHATPLDPTSLEQLTPRLRVDLEWTRHAQHSRWIARDPLTASFYCFNQVERQAVALMSGRLSVADILLRLRRSCPTANVDLAWLGALLARLQVHHLLVPASRAEVTRLTAKRRVLKHRSWWQPWLSPLAIRIPLFDPTGMLGALRPLATLLFQPLVIGFWLLTGVCMGLLVLRELLTSSWSQAFDVAAIGGDRWLVLLVCYLGAKSLHELGHGLACVRTRAECKEIGLMLLCLAPCLYCDTTDSWKLASKWQRAGIAAAGMYVEWILATLAAAIWLTTQAGTLHDVAASLMVVCSVGTLFINSNPLLKYDGYYILSDLWGVPNLADQGRDALRAMGHCILGGRSIAKSHFDAHPFGLAAYALLAAAYRLFILGAIVWIGWSVMVPLGLGFVAVALTALLIGGLVLGQYRGLRLFIRDVFATGTFRPVRWAAMSGLAVLGLFAIVAYPLPSVLRARGVTDFQDKLPLFASQTAQLLRAAPTGQLLPAGTPLLEFQSPESQLELCEVQGQIDVIQEELKQLQLRSAVDPTTAYEIPAKSEQLSELQGRERVLVREMSGLRHTAPHAGFLIAEPQRLPPPITAPRDDRFAAHPLDPSQSGVTCDRSTLLGWLTKKEQMALTVIVPERDVKRLQLGMRGAIRWDSDLNQVRCGVISHIAPEPLLRTPAELVGDFMLPSSRNEQGEILPEKPHYEVTVLVTQAPARLRGAPATVQFEMPAQTVWQRLRDLVRQHLKPLS